MIIELLFFKKEKRAHIQHLLSEIAAVYFERESISCSELAKMGESADFVNTRFKELEDRYLAISRAIRRLFQ